jgi:hypothetical protein
VSPFLFGAGLATLVGALVALSARDTRLILGGLVVTLGLAPVIADPLPSPIAIAGRLVAALLGAELLLVTMRGSTARTKGAALGPISMAMAAGAACVVGYASSGVGSPAVGPPVATAIGFGLVTLALGPLLLGRDVLRIGLGMTLLVTAAELIRAGLAGTPGPMEQAAVAALTIAVLGAIAAIAASALRAGHDVSVEGSVLRGTLFEAHPLAARSASAAAGSANAAGRRPPRARVPAAGPRRDAAAHQLTIEERLRLTAPAEPAPAPVSEPGPESVPADPAEASPPTGGDQPG